MDEPGFSKNFGGFQLILITLTCFAIIAYGIKALLTPPEKEGELTALQKQGIGLISVGILIMVTFLIIFARSRIS